MSARSDEVARAFLGRLSIAARGQIRAAVTRAREVMTAFEGSRPQPPLGMFDAFDPADKPFYTPQHLRGMVMGTPPWSIKDAMLAKAKKFNQKTKEPYVDVPIYEGHTPFRYQGSWPGGRKKFIRITPRTTGWMHPGYGGTAFPPSPPQSLVERLARGPFQKDADLAARVADEQRARASRPPPVGPMSMTGILQRMAQFGDKTAARVLLSERGRRERDEGIQKKFKQLFLKELKRKT